MRDTERDRQRHRQREKQAPPRGTRSWVSRVRPWAEGSAKPLSHLGCPMTGILMKREKPGHMHTVESSYEDKGRDQGDIAEAKKHKKLPENIRSYMRGTEHILLHSTQKKQPF